VPPEAGDAPAHAADRALAVDLARAAGERLLAVRDRWRGDSWDLADAGDRAAQELLAAELAAARPDDAVLSEEALDDPRRHTAQRVWIIDPVDGTREYSEGRDDWAVHVALWDRTVDDLIVGVIALPSQGLILSDDGTAARPRAEGELRIVVSRSRPPGIAVAAARALDATLVPMGSAGAKIAAVVLGQADAYVHAGGQYQWDSAAPVGMARAAGMHTSRVTGEPLRYNEREVYLPDLVVARPELAPRLMAAVKESL
jgi:3'(2'), 5'-bisphosphate nucleotidase